MGDLGGLLDRLPHAADPGAGARFLVRPAPVRPGGGGTAGVATTAAPAPGRDGVTVPTAAGNTLRGRVVAYAIGSTVVLVYVAALAVLEAERHADGSIDTFGKALWWAAVTITTVGYGDVTPVTLTGRTIAVAMMIGGIALLGTITATIASWLVEQVAEKDEASQAATREQVAQLSERIEHLTRLLSARVDGRAPDGTMKGS